MPNILITGGAGFIGGNFVRHWAVQHPGDALVVLDALTYAGNRSTIEGVEQADLIQGNILDTELVMQILRERSIDTIVHFAAETHVDRSIVGPDEFIQTNVVGTYSLLEAARTTWLDSGSGKTHRFHHISTDEVYGTLGPDDPAFTEQTPYAPNSPYSASKAASDHLVRSYHHTYGLETTTTLCSNNYGPYQYPEKLIPFFIINALHGKPLPIYGDGLQVRDWLHVSDHCAAIEACLERGQGGGSYNIGGGHEESNIVMANHICSAIDAAFEKDGALAGRFPNAPSARGEKTASLLEHVTDRPGHDRRYAIDSTYAGEQIGFQPQVDFASGLAETVEWYLANRSWWSDVLK